MLYCKSCARVIYDNVTNCPVCQGQLSIYEPAKAVPPTPTEAVPGLGLRIFLILLAFVIPLASLIVGIVFVNRPEKGYRALGVNLNVLGVGMLILSSLFWLLFIMVISSFV